MKNKEKVLLKAESIIIKYKDDDSIYYRELVKTYKEFKSTTYKDKVKDDLYINHINDLCSLIITRRKSTRSIISMIIILAITIIFACYSTIKYLDLNNNIKNNILKVNKANSLIINYKNLENFNALTLTSEDEYLDLTPLTLDIMNKSLDNKDMHYDIYILEDNDNLNEDEIIPLEAFLYNVLEYSRDNGIKKLSHCYKENNKIRIFSGTIKSNEEISVDIRMWLDENSSSDYTNKKYRFKIFVDGYVI